MSVVAATLVTAISRFLSIYFVLLIVRILLSWFPNIDWSNPVFSTISQLTDPYLNLFRSIIPPIGGLDLSAILAIFALQLITGLVNAAGGQLVAMSYSYGTF
ncbi:MAG: YggT family protein [Phormidesmis sp.]